MDNQNQSFNLGLNTVNQASPPQNPPANPLNTGNGTPEVKEMPIEQLTAASSAQSATAQNPTPSPSPTGPEKSGKKIIIYVIIAILFAAVGYGAYLFFMKGSDEASETNANTPPTIDIASPEMEELEAVVEELRGIYGDNPAMDETTETEEIYEPEDEASDPPSLTIEDSSETEATSTEDPDDAPKVLR